MPVLHLSCLYHCFLLDSQLLPLLGPQQQWVLVLTLQLPQVQVAVGCHVPCQDLVEMPCWSLLVHLPLQGVVTWRVCWSLLKCRWIGPLAALPALLLRVHGRMAASAVAANLVRVPLTALMAAALLLWGSPDRLVQAIFANRQQTVGEQTEDGVPCPLEACLNSEQLQLLALNWEKMGVGRWWSLLDLLILAMWHESGPGEGPAVACRPSHTHC
jgi:hypothetical protein